MNILDTLRRYQDIIPGFSGFVPWSYKRDNTALRRKVKHWAGKDAYFRILAFSRIYLDNFKHIAASWFSEGKEIGMESLHYGADDFGGTIMEENVHRATEWICRADHNDMLRMIRSAGFEPAQRKLLLSSYPHLRRHRLCRSALRAAGHRGRQLTSSWRSFHRLLLFKIKNQKINTSLIMFFL